MSGSKTVILPPPVLKETGQNQQNCSADELCCEKIRESAYYKWVSAGCPCGEGVEFWLQAEAELAAEAHHSRLKK